MLEVKEMEDKKSKTCAYFRQHYGLDGERLFSLYCGHCAKAKGQARKKGKKPDSTACEQYEQAPPATEAFVSREYLSKALLHYVLRLPLLPEIEQE